MSSTPLIFAKGTHYEVAHHVAKTCKDKVQHYYENMQWLGRFEEFYKTREGRAVCEGQWALWEDRFPHYMDELLGIAQGADIDLHKVKLLHLFRELATYLRLFETVFEQAPMGCTDILVNQGGKLLIGHNEDWRAAMLGQDILLCAHISEFTTFDGRTFPEESFLVHTWPGLLPGMNSGFNSHGIFFTIDHLFPKFVSLHNKTADLMLCRHLVTAKSPQDAFNILTDEGYGAAIGFSVNLGYRGEDTLWNVELGPNIQHSRSAISIRQVGDRETYAHYNNYERISVPAMRLKECVKRKQTFENFPQPPFDMASLRAAIGDYSCKENPIYEKWEDGKHACTVATVILDVSSGELLFFVGSAKDTEPQSVIPFSILADTNEEEEEEEQGR